MAQQETIKDFLVQLGFKVDEKGLKTFTTKIDDATAAVTKFAGVITGIAVTAGVAITAFSSNLEDLYFAAQRTGNSATSLKSFEFAARNLGVSANESRSAVEGLASFLRRTPGGASWLEGLGIKTKDANGNLLETTQILQNLGARYRGLPFFQGQQVANVIGGISDPMLLALENSQFAGDVARDKKKRGQGFDKTTEDAHRYQEAIRDLGDTFEALGAKIEDALITKGGPSLQKLENWIEKNGPKIADTIATWVVKIGEFGDKALPVIGEVVDYFIDLDKRTDGLSTKILASVVALKLLGGFGVISGILQLAAAFSSLAAPILAVAAAAAAGGAIGTFLNGLIDKGIQNATGDENQTLGGWLYDFAHNDTTAHTPQAMVDYFKRRGYTTDQSAGLVANIMAESNGDPSATGDHGQAYGIGQWHPDRQAAFKKYTGKDIRGSTLTDQLDFMQYELRFGSEQKANALLLATKNAQQAGEVVSRAYERPAANDAEAEARGRAAVQIAQTTNIHVNGGDAHGTAQQVARAQGDVNQNLVRNAQGALR